VSGCNTLYDFNELINLVDERLMYICTVNNEMPDCQDHMSVQY
jgi:succinate dehydrogenase flavin-adding protein (antitoxin of CptAB toxin-antitoxin module)